MKHMISKLAKFLSRFKSQRRNKHNQKPPIDTRPILEELEPRQLFSGGLEGVLLDDPLTEPPVYLDITNEKSGPGSALVADIQSSESAADTERHELVFIDTQVDNYQKLFNDILAQGDDDRNIEVVLLDNSRNGVDQISETLANYQGLDAIHIISHGSEGSIQLGNTTLNSDNLGTYAKTLGGWQQVLSEDADLLIYGCNLAGSLDGQTLIDELSKLSGADVAASDDLTGNEEFGGDWDLEYKTGEIETNLAVSAEVQSDWSSVLAATDNALWLTKVGVEPVDGFGDPNLAFGDTTDGTFDASLFDLNNHGGKNAEIDAMHFVTRDVTLEKEKVDLLAGDLVFSTIDQQKLDGTKFDEYDVIGFRPDTPGDYSKGSFFTVIDDLGKKDNITALSVVESNTAVDKTDLQAGDLIFSTDKDPDVIQFYDSKKDKIDDLFDGSKQFKGDFFGLELIEESVDIGGKVLSSGTILATLNNDKTYDAYDIVALENIDNDKADDSLFVDGEDVGLDKDEIASFTLLTQSNVNDAPFNVVPVTQATNQDTALVFSSGTSNQLSISDPDANGSAMEVTLNATNGTVTLIGTTGLSFTVGDGTGDASMTFTGTINDINVALDGLSFDPTTSFIGAASLQIFTDDQGNTGTGGPLTDDDTINITVGGVNDVPVNIVPGPQATNQDDALEFSASALNQISISDVDAGSHPMEITLTATNGTVTLANTFGLTFSVGDGTADSTMTFTGTVVDINSALDGLIFDPTLSFDGTAQLQIVTDDQGNTGTGGVQVDTDTVIIAVGINDAPVLAPVTPNFTTITEDDINNGGELVSTLVGTSITDADAGALEGIAVTGLVSGNGTWEYSIDGGSTWNAVGAVANNTALLLRSIDKLRFVPDAQNATSASVTYHAWDQTSGSAGFKVDASTTGGSTSFSAAIDTAGITVTAINDAPDITVAGTQLLYLNGDGAVAIDPALVVSDVDNTNLVSATVQFGKGYIKIEDTLVFTDQLGITGSFDANTGTLTLTGTTTVANYQTALRSVQYEDVNSPPTPGLLQVQFSVNDGSVDSVIDTRTIKLIDDQRPRTSDDSGTVLEGGSVNIDLAANDSPSDAPIDLNSIVITSGPANGMVVINGDGTITYTHNGSETSSDSFTYTIDDTDPTTSNEATVTLTVTPVNDVPVATGNTVIANEDVALVIGPSDFSFTDAESDSLASVTITGLNLNGGTLTHTAGAVTVTNGMTVTAAQLADLTFTSALNDSTDSGFTYTVNDAGTGVTSAVMNITVNAVNDVPVATGNTVIANEDVPLVINASDFSFTDVESDSLASVTITGLTLNGGTLTHSAGAVTVTNGMTITAAQLADLTFTSASNDSTDSSFTYTVNDAGTGVTSSIMNITVNAVNDVPVATGNTVIAAEDVPLVIGAGDVSFTDIESDALASVTITGLTLNGGTLTHSAGAVTVTNGMTVTAAQLADLTFTSALNDSTNSSFTYTVNDAGTGVTSSIMNITVNAVNDVPVATGNTVIANEDVPLVINASDFNFTDIESDSLASVTITGLTLNGGTLTHSAGAVTVTNGMTITTAQLADLTFTSASNDSTDSSFTYTVNDAGAGVTSSVMNITVNAVNDVPVATGNTVIANEDVPLVIGAGDFNFTDVEGDSLASVTITGLTLNGGTLTHTSGTVNVTNGMTITAAQLVDLTFTSALNDSTDSSFTYTVNDADTGVTSAVMNVTVNAVNDVPVATGNTVIANEDVPLVIGAGDFSFTDVESDSLASVTITGLTLNGGTLTHSAGAVTVTSGMTVTLAQLADLTFTSAINDSTNSSFTYSVNDTGSGVTTAVMNITVNAVNDVPVATGNTVIANEDVPLVIGSGDFNFTDVESDSLASVTITGLSLNGGTLTHTGGTVNVTNGMTVTLAQLADLTFTSASNDSTDSSFTYTVNDAGTGVTSAVINITVNAVNDVPVATGNTVIANEDVPLVIGSGDFSFTDVESDSLASVTITGLTLNGGTLTHTGGTVNVTNGMTITAAQLADLTFISGLNDSTNSSFTYTVNDTGTGVTSAVMNITVNAVNDVPVATGNTVIASEDVSLVIGAGDFSFTDVESDSLASVTITGLNLNGGTLTHSAGAVSVTNGMTVTLAQLADLTFTSALNDSTDSSFTYTVNDAGAGVTSSIMNITVNAVNDVPVATGNTVIASEDVPLVIGAGAFNFTDTEGDSLASVTITGLTLNGGTLTHTGGTVNVTNGMTVTAAQLADLTFTSALNDSTDSSLTYTVNDAGAGVTSSIMNITVNAVNDVPVATGNTVIASEDVPLVIGAGDFNFTDNEGDALSSVTITGLNLNGGTLTHTGGSVNVTNGMTVTLAQLADLTFTSALNDSTDSSFTYTVNDAGTGVTSAVINITVNAVNDVPVATGNTVIANEDVALVIGAGDFNFSDVEGDALASVTITGLTLNGGALTHSAGAVNVTNGMTVTAAQLADLTFTSALNDSTDSSFTYTVNDVGTGVTSSVMNITVNAVNDVPVATGNTVIASEDVPLVIIFLYAGDFNFTDVESDSLASVTITGLNLNGGTLTHTGGSVNVTNGMTVTLAQLADLTFTSASNDSTDSSFTYTVNDAGTGITSSVMNITVNAVNDVPVATGNTVIASEDVPLVIGAGDFNFTDVERR